MKLVALNGGDDLYKGSTAFGIASNPRDKGDRSFKFFGVPKKDVCKFFTEKYEPSNIFENWKSIDF